MASTSIYITVEAKEKLAKLADLEHRTLDGQIHFLCDSRLKDLCVPADVNAPSNETLPQSTVKSQA